MKRIVSAIFITLVSIKSAFAANDKTLNVYNWSEYMPDDVIHQFEKETGIHVNYSTYDSNETLYAKIKANPDVGYDVIVPSTYYIDRMIHQDMLTKLDKNRLTNFKNLNPLLLNKSFDPGNQYSIPYLASTTGIVYNDKYYLKGSIKHWHDLWDNKYNNQLLMLDDVREAFYIALISLGAPPNATNPSDIKAAYQQLLALLPNIKLFNDEAVKAIYIDEDANIGVGWSGDIYLAHQANPHIHMVYPEEGYAISIDSMAIPQNAPHIDNAYKFINFVLRPDIAAKIAENVGYMSPNLAAMKYLDPEFRNSPIVYPDAKTLSHAIVQTDVGSANNLYEKFWELLKISA